MYMEIDVPVGTSEIHKNFQWAPAKRTHSSGTSSPNVILLSLSPWNLVFDFL
jgi:hypothetical protein